MSIQQMLFGGRLKPSYVSANTVTNDGNNFDVEVPVNVQSGDLLVFLGCYERDNDRNWVGNTSFQKVFDYSDFTIDVTSGIALWQKIADETDTPGKKYTFRLNGNRKSSAALIAFRNGRVGANGAIYSVDNPGTRSHTVDGAALTYSPSIAVVFLVNGESDVNWSITTPNYIAIFDDQNSSQPTAFIAYQDNVTTNPVPNVSVQFGGGGTGDLVENVMFIVE